ncbi:MAG TPA: TolC family protein [Burkholderiaceae bacterium]
MNRPIPHRPTLLVALLTACATSACLAQAPLSLDAAIALAQERSRQLVAQGAAAQAAREMALAAGQRPDPTLKAGLNNLPVTGADRFSTTTDFMTMRSFGVMQEFTREDKRRARSARFEREAESADAARALALVNLRRDAAMAWLDRHFVERQHALLRTQRDEALLQIDAAEAAYRGARGMQADVFAARAAVAQIDDRLRQLDLQRATSITRLARWIGAAAEQPLADAPDLSSTRVAHDADLVATLAHHPELDLMARQEAVAQAEADVARSNKRSDWSVELMYSLRGSAYSNMVSINVAVPLQWDQANRQDREVGAKTALVEQMRAQREEATREHLAQTRTWLQQWRNGRERLSHYDATLLPLAGERTRAALAAYRGGGGPLTAVLDARRNEIEQRSERLRIEMETAALWAQLEYLIPAAHERLPRTASTAATTTTEATR